MGTELKELKISWGRQVQCKVKRTTGNSGQRKQLAKVNATGVQRQGSLWAVVRQGFTGEVSKTWAATRKMLISFEGHKDSVPAPANWVLGACSQHCGLCPQEAEALLGDNNLGAFNTLTNAHPNVTTSLHCVHQQPTYPELSSPDNFNLLEVIFKYWQGWCEALPLKPLTLYWLPSNTRLTSRRGAIVTGFALCVRLQVHTPHNHKVRCISRFTDG